MKKKKLKTKNITLLLVLVVGIIILVCLLVTGNDKPKKVVKKVPKKEVKEKIKDDKKDKEAPIIKLIGAEEIKMVENSEYEERGAVATDNIDGDITKDIKITNNIDTKKAGDYEVTYAVTDSSKNKTTVKRKVKVIKVDDPDTDGISVLMYHYFYDDTVGQTGENSNYVAKTAFEEHLKYLNDNNYYFPTMKEISMYVDGKIELPKKSVVITMDDGEESNYSIAYPLAVQYKIPMIMFVVTSWTDPSGDVQQNMINSGYMKMQSHSHDMHKGGCGVGHGGLMQCIDYETGVADLKKSKEMIGDGDSFAYPCGDYNDNTIKMLSDAGFTLAFTTTYGRVTRGQNKLALPRVRINGGNSLSAFIGSL